MPFFQDAKSFDIRGGNFQDMQEQHNYTEDRSFKITGDGNSTDYAPDHSVTDNRLYDSRTMAIPGHIPSPPPPPNHNAYMQSPTFVPPQTYAQPSAVEQLQAEVQLLQLQLQSVKLQQEIAASSVGLRPQGIGTQGFSNPNVPPPQPLGYPLQQQHTQLQPIPSNVPQHLHMPSQTAVIPQSVSGPEIYSGQAQQPSFLNPVIQGYIPSQQIPLQNLLAAPSSRPTTVEPSSSVASTPSSSGGDITPSSLTAQWPTSVPQSTAVAANTVAHMNPTPPSGPPSGASQLPSVVVAAPIPTFPSNAIPAGIVQINQGMGTQGNVPAAVEKKKKKRSWLTKLFQKIGLKKKKS